MFSERLKIYQELAHKLLFTPSHFFSHYFESFSSQRNQNGPGIFSSFAYTVLGLSSLSWAVGLYLLRSSYTSNFWLQIILLAIVQFLVIHLSARLLSPYMNHCMQRYWEREKNNKRQQYTNININNSDHIEKLELLWAISSFPMVFFSVFCLFISSLSQSVFFTFFLFLWLLSWSVSLFLLGKQKLYDLRLRQLFFLTFRTIGLFSFLPSLLFSCLILQLFVIFD